MVNQKNVERSLRGYEAMLAKIKEQKLDDIQDREYPDFMRGLRERAARGEPERELLPETFAAVAEAAKRTLGLAAFDSQLLAACAMAEGHIAELPTGEGKTLAAVFTACLAALSGRGVHVLTFNDYLAQRDVQWMRPVYERLGFTVSFVCEGQNAVQRREAYAADVTYLTAREAGFDYLRRFLAFDESEIAQRPFHMAIVDEADSILLDEARIPLVLAGDAADSSVRMEKSLFRAVAGLVPHTDFTCDTEEERKIYLTSRGAVRLEKELSVSNLYDPRQGELLAKINLLLQAVFLLKRDVDYIVRDGSVLLVDAFTGRIAQNRQWPDGLQAAVERKEGVFQREQGTVLNRITLQNFLQYYPFLCGMTGTAVASSSEFQEFYGKTVTVVPPHKPCVRMDRPDRIYGTKRAKWQAVVSEIVRAQESGRPVLVGTATVEESEQLASLLRPHVPGLCVLNAKNDDEEAEIIAGAGRPGAVTISTNMAGRGVDIRLGGKNAEEYARVCALGGLYVIGTSRYESIRIDRQLRGRAGRQGDPGESRFFISLEDDLPMKYHLRESLPARYRESPAHGGAPIVSPAVFRAVLHTQKIAQGQNLDAKITLWRYDSVVEDQRRIVYEKRKKILAGEEALSVLEKENPEKQREIRKLVSEQAFRKAQKAIELFAINRCWADYLLTVEDAMDEVQVIGKVNGDPFYHYSRRLIAAFEEFSEHIQSEILAIFDRAVIRDGRLDLLQMGVRGPTSTRTYLVHDGTETAGLLQGVVASAVNAPLFGLYLLAEWFKKARRREEE